MCSLGNRYMVSMSHPLGLLTCTRAQGELEPPRQPQSRCLGLLNVAAECGLNEGGNEPNPTIVANITRAHREAEWSQEVFSGHQISWWLSWDASSGPAVRPALPPLLQSHSLLERPFPSPLCGLSGTLGSEAKRKKSRSQGLSLEIQILFRTFLVSRVYIPPRVAFFPRLWSWSLVSIKLHFSCVSQAWRKGFFPQLWALHSRTGFSSALFGSHAHYGVPSAGFSTDSPHVTSDKVSCLFALVYSVSLSVTWGQ